MIGMTDIAALIRTLPKAELHVHLEGCITPEQLVSIGERNDVTLFASVEAGTAAYTVSNLDEFLGIFAKASDVLLYADDFAEVAPAHFDNATANAVRHVELMLDLQAHTTRGVAVKTVFDGLAKAQNYAFNQGLSTSLTVNFMRERNEEEAFQLLASPESYRSQIIAVGIDSAENGHPPRKFSKLFQEVRKMGLQLVAHAGFEGPPADIEEAVDILRVNRVNRVDHGNRVYERPELALRLGRLGTAVTVCPRAEVELGVVTSLPEHPVRRMLADGMRPSLHSDDPAWFGSITENYIVLAQEMALTRSEVFQLVRNSFTIRFLPATALSIYLMEIDAIEQATFADR